MNRSFILIWILAMFIPMQESASVADSNAEIDFQIQTERATYSPNQPVHVRFLVTNTGLEPVYLERNLSGCTAAPGSFFALEVLDRNGRAVNSSGCSGDGVLKEDADVVKMVGDGKRWIALQPGEIYGEVVGYEVVTSKCEYQLKGALIPFRFSMRQYKALADNHMRVLQRAYQAPMVSIKVR